MNKKFYRTVFIMTVFLFLFSACDFNQAAYQSGYETIIRNKDIQETGEETSAESGTENGETSDENSEETETDESGAPENPSESEETNQDNQQETSENSEGTESSESSENQEEEAENLEENSSNDENSAEEIPMEEITPPYLDTVENRVWTILIYMPADNNLESAALEDIREMEKSGIDTNKVTILALLDRSSSYDYSENNWYGTRLLRIKTGQSLTSNQIVSEEINCNNLGLSVGKETELDMSSPYTLSGAIKFAMDRFPAERFGLIMWGHGTGWRSSTSGDSTELQSIPAQATNFRGFAYDEKSGTYMTLRQMGTAISQAIGSDKLDFIGFDTCFGGELEVMYELRNYARALAGSEGLVSSSGWNYCRLFNLLAESSGATEKELCSAVVTQFSESYSHTSRASVWACAAEAIEGFTTAFNNCCLRAVNLINSSDKRDNLLSLIYHNLDSPVQRYSYGLEGYDVYLDVFTLLAALKDYFNDGQFNSLYTKFLTERDKAVLASWASDREDGGGPGVYFATLGSGGFLSSNHPSAYIKGKTINQIDFVTDISGWVPSVSGGKSFLDKLFYSAF